MVPSPAFITAPALLIAAIAGTGAMMGGVIVWARSRQRRQSQAARRARELAAGNEPASPGARRA